MKSDPEKIRAWQQRGAKRWQALQRERGRKPLKPVNRGRATAKYDRNYGVDGRRGAAVRAMGCRIAEHPLHTCSRVFQACHSRARGMGGAKGDAGEIWDGCSTAHREAGERGTSQRAAFIERYSFDPELRAAEIKAELDERFGPEPCWKCKQTVGHTLLCPTVEGRTRR